MIKAVLFDCDGVLIDSYVSTISFLQDSFASFNLRVPETKEFYPYLGLKTPDIIKTFFSDLTEEEFTKLYAYSMVQSLIVAGDIPLMPHLKETLTLLSQQYKLGIISNRGTETLTVILEKNSLRNFFQIVLSRDDVKRQKPHPEPLLKALKTLNLKSNEAVFVGDTEIDVTAAHGAFMKCIIYKKEPTNLGDYQLTDFLHLPTLIEKISARVL